MFGPLSLLGMNHRQREWLRRDDHHVYVYADGRGDHVDHVSDHVYDRAYLLKMGCFPHCRYQNVRYIL